MLSLKTLPSLHLPFSSSLRLRPSHPSLRRAAMSTSTTAAAAAADAVEHVVLFKLRPEAAAPGGGADAMLAALRALAALPGVSHIHAGPVLRLRSPAAAALAPTHLLHSRYPTKADLASYASHPSHVSAVQSLVLPIALDITAVDWVNSNPAAAGSASSISPGSAVRLTLAKVKEGVEVKQLVDKVAAFAGIGGKASVSFGENFSPARAKGYQFGMVAVFDSVEKLDAVEGDDEVEKAKEAVKPLLDEVLVLDFVVEPSGEAPAAPASL